MIITTHSGCDGTPENSVQYLNYALALSPDAVEVDVHRRRDGVLVLYHDPDPEGLYPGALTLEEAFRILAARPDVAVNCDLKDRGLEEAVCSLHAAMLDNPLVFSGSVSPALWRSRSDLRSGAALFLNLEEVIPDVYEKLDQDSGFLEQAARTAVGKCRECGADAVNVDYRICVPPFLEILSEGQIRISAWTVDDLAEAVRLAEAGIHSITTCNAAVFLQHFGRDELR